MKLPQPEIRLAMLGMIEGNGHPYCQIVNPPSTTRLWPVT